MKKIIVTSGGNIEKIDDFRVLTNVSTGALGAKIAERFVNDGWDVDFVCTRYSKQPKLSGGWWERDKDGDEHFTTGLPDADKVGIYKAKLYEKTFTRYTVESAQDAFNILKTLIPNCEYCCHSMAVADFGFKKDKNIKLKSTDLQGFVDYIKQKAIVNPKIISHFREWNPDPKFYIIQFKFEINTTEEELVNIAIDSCKRNGSNLCVANDKLVMKEKNSHNSLFVKPDGSFKRINGKDNIADEILKIVNENCWK